MQKRFMRHSQGTTPPQTILIVDDQQENLILLEAGLRDLATIITCHDPQQALLLAKQYKPDIAILDVEMPHINGFSLCQKIKANPLTQHTSVIFITSHNDFENESKALALGAIDFIGRPINLNVCRMRVSNHLQIKAQESLLADAYSALQKEKEHLHVTLNSIGDAVITTDQYERVTFINPVAQRLTGWTASEAIGQPVNAVLQLSDSSTKAPVPNPVSLALREDRIISATCNTKLTSRNGHEYRVEDTTSPIKNAVGQCIGAAMVFQDITESIAMATQMSHLANHDQLTGLPNRLLLHDRLCQAIARNSKAATKLAVLIVDLDNFKYLNDTLGHQAGDQVISQLSERLNFLCDSTITLCRIGGDEFALMLSDVDTSSYIDTIAGRVAELVARPVPVDGQEYSLTVSVGISVFPDDATNEKELVHHADTAMYRAKSAGRNCVCYYSDEIQHAINNLFHIGNVLKRALEEDSLEVFYQPKFDLFTGEISGAEGLVRLRNDDGSIIPPDQFISLAEESGLIHQLGDQVLRKCCAAARRWQLMGKEVKVAVNIAALQFSNSRFYDSVMDALQSTELPARLLELEVTESALMHDFDQTQIILQRLSQTGITIALDDFGTGYSSLSYLRFFPLDVLKVDRSFVKDMHSDNQAENIVCAIIHLAQSMQLTLVAEGIETTTQLETLREYRCDEGQGYFFSKPLAECEFETFFVQPAQVLPALSTVQALSR